MTSKWEFLLQSSRGLNCAERDNRHLTRYLPFGRLHIGCARIAGTVMGAFRGVLLFFSIWLMCGSAQAERRIALVMGNSAYKSAPRLSNPVNNAGLVGEMF